MHLGLEGFVPYIEYMMFVASFLLSVFWRPIVGICFLLPLLPLQTIRYRLNELPLGGSAVGIVLLGIVLGLWRSGQPIVPKGPWTKVVFVYIVFTFVSLWFGSFYLGGALPLPGNPRFGVWQDYVVMPFLLLLTAAVTPTRSQMRLMIVLMCVATLLLNHNFWNTVSDRSFSVYSDDLRESGSMGYAGTNGLAAFEAQIAGFLLAISAMEKRMAWRLGFYGLAMFSAVCLTYSLSRGGYLAILTGVLFLGVVKQRVLLILLLGFLLTWRNIVPAAVQERVLMTYDQQTGTIDHSAETRLSLWENAMQVVDSNVVFGTGFNTYAYMHLNKRTDGGKGYYEDTHNFYLKVLVETGIVGLLIFLWFLGKTFWSAYSLFRRAKDPFFASLGLGLATWVVCAVTANLFGDRWTFLQVNAYMWVIGGMVSHALLLERADENVHAELSHQKNSVWADAALEGNKHDLQSSNA